MLGSTSHRSKVDLFHASLSVITMVPFFHSGNNNGVSFSGLLYLVPPLILTSCLASPCVSPLKLIFILGTTSPSLVKRKTSKDKSKSTLLQCFNPLNNYKNMFSNQFQSTTNPLPPTSRASRNC